MFNKDLNNKVLSDKEKAEIDSLLKQRDKLSLIAVIIFILFFISGLAINALELSFIFYIIPLFLIICAISFMGMINNTDQKIENIIKIAESKPSEVLIAVKKKAEEFYKSFCIKHNIAGDGCTSNDIILCIANSELHITESFNSYMNHYDEKNIDASTKLLPVKHTAIPVSDIQKKAMFNTHLKYPAAVAAVPRFRAR